MSNFPDDKTFQENPYFAPQPTAQYQQNPSDGDATGGLIPYKNVPALLAYYLGLFSMFPCIGLFLAIPAFILGIIGLRRRAANPAIKGSVHAWIGIVMGGIFTVIWGLGLILFIIGLAAQSQR